MGVGLLFQWQTRASLKEGGGGKSSKNKEVIQHSICRENNFHASYQKCVKSANIDITSSN